MSQHGELLCLDSLPEALIVADASGRVLYLNRRARRLFGQEDSPSEEGCLADFLPGMDVRAAADNGTAVRLEYVRPDGSGFCGEACAAVEGERWFVSIREAASTASPAGLAEAALEQQRAFFSLFNHDVRQSLQAIQFLTETLEPSAPETVAVIGEIVGSVRRLLDTVLRLNDTGALAPAPERCSLGDILQSLRLELEPMAARKSLALEIAETSEELVTDPVLFRELLQNLVGNAIRYTPAGGVRIDCFPSGVDLHVVISDTGIGMTPTQLERLLAAESRAEPRPSAPAGGTGLGLVIVKRLTDLLGYRLEAASTLGQGSSFKVVMPRAPGDTKASAPPSIGAG
jgi:signal transduction histidine kinase